MHILLKRINKWSDEHDKINDNQFGFQKSNQQLTAFFIERN